jgi:hypothetical protein
MNSKKQLRCVILSVLLCGTSDAANYPLKISSTNPRILVDQNNAPYLMVGDSPQGLIANLTTNEAAMFFADRAAHGFNTVWINLLCSTYTGGRADVSTIDGIVPFTNTIPSSLSNPTITNYDLTTPNEAYFARVDQMLKLAAQQGIQVLLDPCETGSFIFQSSLMRDNGADKCLLYGKYLGNRYKDFPNIIWLNGNDFQGWMDPNNDAVVAAVALGIKDNDTKHIHTVELNFNVSSSLDDLTWSPIISLNAAYTYYPTYAEVLHAYNQSISTPVFMIEAHYEFEAVGGVGETGTAQILRRQEYWSMLSGVTGQLYGNHYTWQFISGWQIKSNLDTTGTTQLGYMKALFEPRAWYDLIPDQDHSVVTNGYGTFTNSGSLSSNDYATAARTADGTLVMVYVPTIRTLTVDMSKLSGPVTARWFDPANGTYSLISGSPFCNTGTRNFTPSGNNSDGDGDWILLLEIETQLKTVLAPGNYDGLFYEVGEVRQASAGFFTVSSTPRKTYSGRLQLGANRYTFSGQLDLQGVATNIIQRRGANPLTVEFQAGACDQADQITGRVTDGIWVATLLGNRAVFNSKTNPAPYAGSYTLCIRGQNNDPSVPAGDGFGTVRVSTSGQAKFVGALADRTKVSQSVSLSKNGNWPLYVSLYSGKGSLVSWLTFTNQANSDLNGKLSWIKTAGVVSPFYPAGFTNECNLVGSVYVPPVGAMNHVLQLTNALVEFSGGNLSPDFTNSVALGQYNRVTNLSSNRLTLSFSLSTGTFRGSVVDPVSRRPLTFSGAVFQKLDIGCGFLLGTNQSSRVTLTQ